MKIAVCDDDRTTREQIASLIREQEPDAEVVTFEAGEEMIKSQENFAVSFLDVEMKEISGIDVAKHMREEQEKRGRDKSSNKKVVFHTKDGKIDTYGRMDDWETELGDSFYRCHRGYLVNLEKITAYSVDTIDLINGDSLILAQKKYSDFIKAYMRYAKDGGIVNV